MKPIYIGKTKDVYRLEDNTIKLKFKDDVTGEDGVFDPGANTIGLTLDGAGKSGLRVSKYFFEKLKEFNIPTHYISADIKESSMLVKDAEMFGNGLEVICRYKAVGSFYRRYGQYCEEGEDLSEVIEFTLKDNLRNDPPILKDGLIILKLLNKEEYDEIKRLTKEISRIVKNELMKKDIELYDTKLVFEKNNTDKLILIDEISGGNMRVYKKDNYIPPLELEPILFN